MNLHDKIKKLRALADDEGASDAERLLASELADGYEDRIAREAEARKLREARIGRVIPPELDVPHREAHRKGMAATQATFKPRPPVRHARGQHPDHCGACRAHTVIDEVASGARPHEHATAEFPETCGICRAQQVSNEGHPHADV